jgi:hypothetical protein
MIRRCVMVLATGALIAIAAPAGARAAEGCETEPRPACFGIASGSASLSTIQAGAHPDVSLDISVKTDPLSTPNVFGLRDAYAPTRDLRIEAPPGLMGDPNALGASQQCTVVELVNFEKPGGGCPNASQIGISDVFAYELPSKYHEPVYMMQPPGGNVAARVGMIAGIFPVFIDFRLRSGSDYGLTAEVRESPAAASVVELDTTIWGVPAAEAHDRERCTSLEALQGCVASLPRPPGGRRLPFFTNPTRCGVPLAMRVSASSWVEPERFDTAAAPFEEITGCNRLPFGPSLEAQPTSHRTSSPTGLDLTIKLPASEGVEVLEPSQIRSMRIDFPPGLAINTDASDGLATCSAAQVGFEEDEASHCPDAAKLAATEFEVPVLERNLKGAIYLREPEPGDPFRVWIVADDLGLHLKLPGDLEVDKATGQVHSIVLGAPQLEGLPQAPLREVKLLLKSGFRAPLITPDHCGTFYTHYEFVPWSGGPPAVGSTPMQITEGCDTGGFDPELQAGSSKSGAGSFSPFQFTIERTDSEQNIAGLRVALPKGLTASFLGVARCEGAAAVTGQCPPDSRVGKVVAAVGAGPQPLWIPQPGKRSTGIYLSGPYKGAPLSIIAVVPKQAGPFDFGDEVVRSAIFVDPVTAEVTAVTDPLPQFVEGIPLLYKTLHVELDRPNFSLNPTSCAPEQTTATLTSVEGAVASPAAPFAATDCAKLAFRPRLALTLRGGVKRGAHPALRAVFRPRSGDANARSLAVRLPHSIFLDQGHIRTVCTRVQFAAGAGGGAQCPSGSVYGRATAHTPLFDFPLEGPVYLRSSDHALPDMVLALHGPSYFPVRIDSVGRIDSQHGGIRSSFESLPDAPLSSVVLEMQGGKKGLIENAPPGLHSSLCGIPNRAAVDLDGQNGKAVTLHPQLRPLGCKRHTKKSRRQERPGD